MTEQSYTGFWWEDGAATEQQPGTLTIAADGKAELDLIRGFDLFTGRKEIESGGITFESLDERPIKVLHGVADNKEFTLLGCRSSHVQLNSLTGKPDKQTLRVRRVLLGIHLKDSGQPVFKSCTLQIENMQRGSNKDAQYFVQNSRKARLSSLSRPKSLLRSRLTAARSELR